MYKRSGDTFTKLPNPATLPAGTGRGAAFSPDGIHLSVAHATSPYITIYKRSGDTFTKLTDPATLPADTGFGTAFSPDGSYLSVAHSASPFIAIYSAGYDASTEFVVPFIPVTEESVHYIKAES
jgi:DNA-binding beta-propeller fold protein YncE